ncbi:MAG: metallophosphoesterase family protein [bacterium]
MKFVHTADTHLGFEITRIDQSNPQGRKKRSDSIFQNFLTVIDYAKDMEADLFIHSGDLFNKDYIPGEILNELIQPLVDLGRLGTQVVIIPGNHERSQFPFDLFLGSSGVYVIDEPKALLLNVNGYAVNVAGFPFIRKNSKWIFHQALRETEYEGLRADFNILVSHQAFDQAVVGPHDFTFKAGRSDTVLRDTVPTDFDYIAAGHIHKHQILPHPLKTGLYFVYPGSTQRISFAEIHDEKGFIKGEIINNRIEIRFVPLAVYDMEVVEIKVAGFSVKECQKAIEDHAWRFNDNLVIRFNLIGGATLKDYPVMDFQNLREELPSALECQFAIKTEKRWVKR